MSHAACATCEPRPQLLAAIDIGTVSTRLIVARPAAGGRFDVLERQAHITDLGEGVDATGRLAPHAIARTTETVARYLGLVRAALAAEAPAQPQGQTAPAQALTLTTTTSAARDAANARELTDSLRHLGLEPQVIAGGVEATLALLGVTADFPAQRVLVADVGGGSTELTAGLRNGQGELAQARGASYNVGCRRVTERFFSHDGPVSAAEEQRARAFVAKTLAPHFDGRPLPSELVCVGGTATSLVSVAHGLVPYDPSFVHLRRVARATVNELTERLLGMSVEERAQLPGLQPKRARVAAAGALILDVLLELGEWDAYTVSESDSLVGLLSCLRAISANGPSPIDWAPRTALIA